MDDYVHLDVGYYGDAKQGVYERAGLIRGDIRTRYARSRGFAPAEKRFFVLSEGRGPEGLRRLGAVTDLDLALYRVDADGR